jgi:hypothetical protein
MSNPLPTLLDDLALNTLVNQVVTAQRDLQGNLQTCIVQCVLAAKANGNLNALSFLVNGLLQHGKRKHFKNIETYIKDHTPIKFTHNKSVQGQPLNHANGEPLLKVKLRSKYVESDWKLDDMLATTWGEYAKPKKESEAKEFSFTDTIKKAVAKLDKLLSEGGDPAYMDNLRMQRALAKQAMDALGLTA